VNLVQQTMAFSDSNSQLTTLTREIATLTATLQREKQRRAAIASHAKEIEHRAITAENKLKQVQYANKKLEEELNHIKENVAENRSV
jgi:septal ring factor EnvC (AmiA/AmiB activator)